MAGDAYYVPPGHTPVHYAGAEIVEFSPTEAPRDDRRRHGQRRARGSAVMTARTERLETVVIGAGQAGLSVGHRLASARPFVILDAEQRVGDNWRRH